MLEVSMKDVRMEFCRDGGPGGQHRNKTESSVRLTHVPTGITVKATERRSQHQNRALAFERLAEKLAAFLVRPEARVATAAPAWSADRRLEDKAKAARRRDDRRAEC